MTYVNFTPLYLSLQRLSEVLDQRSLSFAGGAPAIGLVPNDCLHRGMAVEDIRRATLEWLNRASLATLSELIARQELANGTFFVHEGQFYGKGITAAATIFWQGKPPKSDPILHTKLKTISPDTILRVYVHPRNYTGDSASVELSGLHRLFLVARLTVSVPPILEAQAYAIGHMHKQPMGLDRTVDEATLASLSLSENQRADYRESGYLCCDSIHIPGGIPGVNGNLLLVNAREILLTDQSFRLLLRLVVELKKEKDGWISNSTLRKDIGIDATATDHQLYYNLRTSLRSALFAKNPLEFIQNNGSKEYRISTHPDFITYDKSNLLNHPTEKVREIANGLP